jgi:uncharacterized integral membrane protein (TIGR00698 family)
MSRFTETEPSRTDLPGASSPGERDYAAPLGVSAEHRWSGQLHRLIPGLSIVTLVALAAAWLAEHYKAPVMLFALLLGMAINFVGQDARCRPGIDFAARTLLRIGVALLGARITLAQAWSLGGETLLLTFTVVVVTILAGWALARVLRLRSDFGVLTGGAVAICGASAALALSSVLPPSPTRERDTILTVVGVTALSTAAMVVYPVIAANLGLDEIATGVFLGATIHDIAQVVGAGYDVSKNAGDTATLVKLIRVFMLLPIVLIVALIFRQQAGGGAARRPPLAPAFLIGFAVLVAANSVGLAPPALIAQAGEASRWLLLLAIAAVGTKTSLGEISSAGWRPALLIVLETAVPLGLVLTVFWLRH